MPRGPEGYGDVSAPGPPIRISSAGTTGVLTSIGGNVVGVMVGTAIVGSGALGVA
jgi:hypothetical protein